MNGRSRPVGRLPKSAGGRDSTKSTPTTRTRTEYLLDELTAGRWPGAAMPRTCLEQVVALAALRHPDERDLITTIVPPSAFRDHEARMIFEAAIAVELTADDQYVAVCERLHDMGLDRSPVDVMLAGGDLVFVAGGCWRLALTELGRRIECDRVRDAITAAVVSLDGGADPGHVAERLVRRVVAADA